MPKLFNFDFYKRESSRRVKSWAELIGDASVFSLESRIFHSISLGLIVLCCLYIPYNFYAGLYVASLSAFLFGLLFYLQYYYSRFRGKAHSNVVFAFTGLIVFGINYFANSGINGSTDLIWPAYLLIVFAISPRKQHLNWLVIYLLIFFILHAVEYYYPFLVKHPFTAGTGQFVDRITAFPLPVLVIYIIIKFIRRSYDLERKLTEEKSIAIEISKQQILLQNDKLEQRDIEKSKLMSIISHDLRNPLLNVQNYLTILSGTELDNDDRAELEKSLLNSTNHAVSMLSNLLSWSKSQMEGTFVNLVEIDLREALVVTLEMEKLYASKKDIILNYDIPAQLKVIADIDMLQLIVRNLVSNSVKFTQTGGLVEVEVETTTNECKITVTDNGRGIAPEEQQNIFSIKAAHTYGTNNERGVGLGLVLCKEFIERQGGRIGFESVVGMGSEFFVFLKRG